MPETTRRSLHDVGRSLKFWNDENSLSVMLTILIFHLVVMTPLMQFGAPFQLAGALLITLGVLPSAMAMVHTRRLRALALGLILCAAGLKLFHFLVPLFALGLAQKFFALLLFLLMLYMVGRQLAEEGPVTPHRVRGAMAMYILIGLVFAYIYAAFNGVVPESFNLPEAARVSASGGYGEMFYYFSIVTLTTVGFGDISAVSPFARSLVMIEALIGQLYPAIIIARMVSMPRS